LLLEIVKLDRGHQAARVALAEIAWSSGDRAGARTWLEEAISADPAAVDARLRLAQIAFVEADNARARGLLEQAISAASDKPGVLTAVGKVLAQAGLTDDAFARFREASASGARDATLAAARLHLDLDQRAQARELIESALPRQGAWREAERLLVTIDARDGQVEKAFSRAKALMPDASPDALQTLHGDLQMMAGKTDEAIADYEHAQRRQPSSELAIRIFNARRAAGAKPAETSLVQWLERSPDDAHVRRVLAAYYEVSGDQQLAIVQYERLLAADQTDPITLNNLAWSLHARKDPRAVQLAERAYAAAPHLAEIGDTYGWILVQMDKVAEGLAVLDKALAMAPANPEIQYHVAVAHSKSGKSERARELLRQALQSKSKFASRADAESLLQTLSAAGS
jgi:putative PEP-CTERM system TPR-repeat lipoprotein